MGINFAVQTHTREDNCKKADDEGHEAKLDYFLESFQRISLEI